MSCRLPLALAFLFAGVLEAQVADAPDGVNTGIPVNYTESKVGSYTLPDPLQMANGDPVRSPKCGSKKGVRKF
jgi:hypothetical protein